MKYSESYSEYSLYIPREIINKEKNHPLLSPLMPLETGFFKKALGHGIYQRKIDEYVLIYCIEGVGYLDLAERGIKIDRGELIFCPEEIPHSYWADPDNPWSIYWLHFKGILAPSLMAELNISQENPLLKIGVDGELIKNFQSLSQSFRGGHGFSHLYRNTTMTQQLFSRIVLLKNYSLSLDNKNLTMEKILNYMRDNIENRLNLDDLSRDMGLSKYHLSRKFHQASGYAPMAYFTQLKIQRACELLDTTDMSIKEISAKLSFNTPYYFSESFKRIIRLSPMNYRRERQRSVSQTGLV